MNKRRWITTGLVTVLLAGIQLSVCAAGKSYYLTQMTMSAYYAVVALGLCLVMGYAGQISLGHGGFFAIGGYTSAVLTTLRLSVTETSGWGKTLLSVGILEQRTDLYGAELIAVAPGIAFLVAMVLAALIALLVGYPSLRLKGHYLAMATLGFGLIVYRIVLGSPLTGAADGITSVPPWEIAGALTICGRRAHRVANYYFAWGFTIVVLQLLLNLVRSRPGRALRSIHDGELAAGAMGINTGAYKLRAFVLSALLAAAAGSFMTHYSGGIGPSEAGAMKSVRYVALVAVGGMANLWGVLVLSTVLNFLSLRGMFGTMDHTVFGGILILIVSLAPEGPLQPIAAGARRLWTGGRAWLGGRRAAPVNRDGEPPGRRGQDLASETA